MLALTEADERAEAHLVIAYGFQPIDQLFGIGLGTSPFVPRVSAYRWFLHGTD